MYLTMYITAYNQFTDVPAASTIVPFRVPMDQQTLMHISSEQIKTSLRLMTSRELHLNLIFHSDLIFYLVWNLNI